MGHQDRPSGTAIESPLLGCKCSGKYSAKPIQALMEMVLHEPEEGCRLHAGMTDVCEPWGKTDLQGDNDLN